VLTNILSHIHAYFSNTKIIQNKAEKMHQPVLFIEQWVDCFDRTPVISGHGRKLKLADRF